MNIFVLDTIPEMAARCHCDKHVVKMVLESAQLLCTAHRVLDPERSFSDDFYKATHKNHPCAKWARESISNYRWLYSLFTHLCREYTYRYNKIHLCEIKLKSFLSQEPMNIPLGDLTPFVSCMGESFRIDQGSAVENYRNYYRKGKKDILHYTGRNAPSWI